MPTRDENERRLLKKEWGKIVVRRQCYVSNELGKNEKAGYYAAGICPFLLIHDPETGKSELSMLLVRELRHGHVKLNFLGGKRERGELPNETAYREFLEETAGLLDEQKGTVKRLIKDKTNQRLWLGEGRYILISISSPTDWLHLPSRFERWKEEKGCKSSWDGVERKVPEDEINSEQSESNRLKTKGLVWVSVRELGESSMKAQLSQFLKSIFQFSTFEDFVNAVPVNPEYYEIAKYFEAEKWVSSPPVKRSRESHNMYNSPWRRRLNNDRRELAPRNRYRPPPYFQRHQGFYPNPWNSYHYC